MDRDASDPDVRRVAGGIVVVVGLYQGAIPLVVRAAFGGDQRFAPALWLPSPWWWVACLAIVAATIALVAVLEDAGTGDSPTGDSPPADAERDAERGKSTVGYEALSNVVFLLGAYNGLAPFVARLVFDGDLMLAVTLRLPSPWWWIASLGVLAVAVVLLALIDDAKQRHLTRQR